jgi:xanthine dehydrogenase accessory factor
MGASAVAQSLIKLGNALDYEVLTGMEDKAIPQSRSIYAVVATQGDGDEAALQKTLKANPLYLGFVASRKKADAVKEILLSRGVSEQQLEKIKAPAGLDIKARRPEEIALSILAEIVMIVREQLVEEPVQKQPEQAIDPICGMKVTVDNAKYVFDHQETAYYFCCDGCRTTFEQDPEKYC